MALCRDPTLQMYQASAVWRVSQRRSAMGGVVLQRKFDEAETMCAVNSMTFKTGDLVALKSGGPRMTVTAMSGDCEYCVWFYENEQKQGTFDIHTLDAAAEDAWFNTASSVIKSSRSANDS